MQWVSVLFGFKSQLKLPYVTSFALSFGTLSLLMKKIVFVPFTLPSLRPCASHPNLFAADLSDVSCVLGLEVVCGNLGTLLFPCRGLPGPVLCVGIGVSLFGVAGVFCLCC